MHFELKLEGDALLTISYRSSKESFVLGTLTFIDGDGDKRPDVRVLLMTLTENNPMFVVDLSDQGKGSL